MPNSPKIEVTAVGSIGPIADVWDEIDKKALGMIESGQMCPIDYTFYQTRPWNEFVEQYYADHRRPFSRIEYIVASIGETPVALLPLRISGFLKTKVEMTAWRTAGVNNVSTTLTGQEAREVCDAIVGFIAARYRGARLRLFDIPAGSPFAESLAGVAGAAVTERDSYHIPLSEFENFEAYYASLSKKLRHNIQTRSNHFTHGDLRWELKEYDRANPPSDEMWHRIWRIFYRRKLDWNSKSDNPLRRMACAWQTHNEVRRGMRVASFSRLEGARLSVFEINGVPAAFAFYYTDTAGHIVAPKLAMDMRFRTHAPGILMLKALIEQLYRQGVRDFDLCRGEEPYKQQMGAVCQKIVRVKARL